ncbi:glycosyltransferase, partial [Micromonospora azadirachtae]
MRILIPTTAGRGHFLPIVPFAEALRKAGHEVLVAAPGSFREAVEQTGLDVWPCADEAPDESGEAFTSFAERAPQALLPGVLAAIDSFRPHLILRDMAELASLIAGVMRNVPQVQVLFGLGETLGIVDRMLPVVSAWSAAEGVDLDALMTAAGTQPTLSLLPESYDGLPPVPHGPIHRFSIPDAVHPRTAGDKPLVYLSFGTVSGAFPFGRPALHAAATALADLPIRLVVSLGGYNPEDADTFLDRTGVRVEPWIHPAEEARIIASADVVVGHGGAGTTLACLRNGVPQVAVPLFGDQPLNASRMEAAGV